MNDRMIDYETYRREEMSRRQANLDRLRKSHPIKERLDYRGQLIAAAKKIGLGETTKEMVARLSDRVRELRRQQGTVETEKARIRIENKIHGIAAKMKKICDEHQYVMPRV